MSYSSPPKEDAKEGEASTTPQTKVQQPNSCCRFMRKFKLTAWSTPRLTLSWPSPCRSGRSYRRFKTIMWVKVELHLLLQHQQMPPPPVHHTETGSQHHLKPSTRTAGWSNENCPKIVDISISVNRFSSSPLAHMRSHFQWMYYRDAFLYANNKIYMRCCSCIFVFWFLQRLHCRIKAHEWSNKIFQSTKRVAARI
jgi:hypothetical protein